MAKKPAKPEHLKNLACVLGAEEYIKARVMAAIMDVSAEIGAEANELRDCIDCESLIEQNAVKVGSALLTKKEVKKLLKLFGSQDGQKLHNNMVLFWNELVGRVFHEVNKRIDGYLRTKVPGEEYLQKQKDDADKETPDPSDKNNNPLN